MKVGPISGGQIDPIVRITTQKKNQGDKDNKVLDLNQELEKEKGKAILRLMGKGNHVDTQA